MSDGDCSLIDILEELCHVEQEQGEEDPDTEKTKQTTMIDWGVSATRKSLKVEDKLRRTLEKKPLLQMKIEDWWSQTRKPEDSNLFVPVSVERGLADNDQGDPKEVDQAEDETTVSEVCLSLIHI